MIKVWDNFLPDNIYRFEKDKLINGNFERVVVGEKDFHVITPDSEFLSYVIGSISNEMNADIELILSFFRLATDEIDTDWRIHSDLNINGQRPTHAGVLYFSQYRKNEPNPIIVYSPEELLEFDNNPYEIYGTAFWKHKEYGSFLKPETTDEEYDRLLEIDANDISKWDLDSVVSAKENRLLIYEANKFHSKYPNKSWIDEDGVGRMVLVLFFNLIKPVN